MWLYAYFESRARLSKVARDCQKSRTASLNVELPERVRDLEVQLWERARELELQLELQF